MPTLDAHNQRRLVIVAFLIAPLTLLVLFSIWPAVQLAWISLTDWNGMSSEKPLSIYRITAAF